MENMNIDSNNEVDSASLHSWGVDCGEMEVIKEVHPRDAYVVRGRRPFAISSMISMSTWSSDEEESSSSSYDYDAYEYSLTKFNHFLMLILSLSVFINSLLIAWTFTSRLPISCMDNIEFKSFTNSSYRIYIEKI